MGHECWNKFLMIWKIKDKIKRGFITYEVGDEVVLFRRKSNGYPNGLKYDVKYFVIKIEDDFLHICTNKDYCVGFDQVKKIHKTYMVQKSELRDEKINSILD